MKWTVIRSALSSPDAFSKAASPASLALLLVITLFASAPRAWAQAGTMVAWGDNRVGQGSVPSGISDIIAIAAGEWHNLALKSDGKVIMWGHNASVPSDLSGVVAIGAGGYHNMAVKSDGTIRAWGKNDYGQINVPAGLRNVVSVKGGWVHSIALKSDGTVVAWGRNNEGQANVPTDLNNVVAIAAGEYHNLALRSDGTVRAWGWNGTGATTVPSSLGNQVAAIAAGGLHSLALKKDGTVVAWGWNHFGQTSVPAGLRNVIAIAAGAEHSLALKSDGTVVGWGANDAWASNDQNCQNLSSPCPRTYTGQSAPPAGLNNVVAIAAGVFHSIALKGNATTPPPPPLKITNPKRSGTTFTFAANTQSGKTYDLEYKSSPTATTWTTLSTITATGPDQIFTDPNPSGTPRYYRLRQR